ncbi:hypothetical protein SanaruYs_37450 [Chryseotalea sanaruensis]|uniref:Lipoprotein n=1 Tax=Chryseotalea sanaruensis TaxID=2482724 RepID=A0A401UF71_9BACT|nr:hypothetical protein [Chryseotalea sanaruensis]GCC53500.1 hypothetical protein SanaruYs_37450 [Chryseotalea sanaruensis]
MKHLFQFALPVLLGCTVLVSCEKKEASPQMRLCDTEYFYYASAGVKVNLKQSLSEMWIVFGEDEITKEDAESILNKYSFIEYNVLNNNYSKVWVRLKENSADCATMNNYLKILNEDDEIYSATPLFYLVENDLSSYFILISEVLTKNNESLISEPDFIDYVESMNLELVGESYNIQYFKVKEVVTGFESLEMANQIYESGKAEYAEPNGIVNFVLH